MSVLEQPVGSPPPEASPGGVVVTGVQRSFGDFMALREVNLTVPAGQVTALVGPNGAGKTTLLLILATLLSPDTGSVLVGGIDLAKDPKGARAKIGWSPDVFGMYDNLSVGEYLKVFARAYRLPKAEQSARVAELLKLARLDEFTHRPVHVLSRGQKQRLNLMRALIHRPEVLLLDEPASGLDPRSRVELRDLLRSLAGQGVAVLVSSHILSDLEEVADRVVFVDHGQTVGEGALSSLMNGQALVWRVRALDNQALTTAVQALGLEARPAGTGGVDIEVADETAAAKVISDLVGRGVQVVSASPQGSSLEAAYLRLTEGQR